MATNKIKNNGGFSLVEMLVAVGIFMSIMTIAISSLISIIGANKKAQAIKSTIDSVTFVLEDISRDMRIGTDYKCSSDGVSFTNSDNVCILGTPFVRYTNSLGNQITYKFDNSILTKEDSASGIIVDLISQDSDVNITNMKFYVIGAENEIAPLQSNRTQPRTIITISGLISVKGSDDSLFNLQTSISQRTRR